MNEDLVTKAKRIISTIEYVTIATSTKDGTPWNSPVFTSFDEDFNFYWVSWKENVHSRNIRENNRVFIVIYDSTAPAGTGEGVYIQAHAHELEDVDEVRRATVLLRSRHNLPPREHQQFLGQYPRRVYKAVPEKVWMNADKEIDGNYIDTRVEIDLLTRK